MAELSSPASLPVSTLIGDPVVRVDPDADLHELSRILARAGVGAVAVIDGDDLVGVASERDVVQALAGERDPATTRARDIASKELVWCDASASVEEAAAEMMEHYLRHVLVEEDGRLIGMVSARDLLGVYATEDLEPE